MRLTDEQLTFSRVLESYLDEKYPRSPVRRPADGIEGFDVDVWRGLIELGAVSLHLPERYGGGGATFYDLGIVIRELGRRLYSGPFFSSFLAAQAILNIAHEEQRVELLPRIAAGEVATVGITEQTGRWDAEGITATCEESGGAFLLRGTKMFVPDASIAKDLYVVARHPLSGGVHGISLFHLSSDAPGVTIRPQTAMDLTRSFASVTLEGAEGRLLGVEGEAWLGLSITLDQGRAALSSEMAGGAEETLSRAVEHANNRVQFSRPIGSFQAVKHKCAEMLIRVQGALASSSSAMRLAGRPGVELTNAALVAKAYCSPAFEYCASESLHIHGGIGFTWESDSHLYFRRAKTSAALLGDAHFCRGQLAATLLDASMTGSHPEDRDE